jgi:LysR family glycine cleavage system transcriptional activator
MSDRLPPLTALRAFEAAARHLSFAKAAHELNVTPAALSFQIKSLEEHLGTPVFRRLNRAVELTEAGRSLAPGTSEGFANLTTAWRNTQRLSDNKNLTITAGPAFTAKWLAPRLYQFAQAHPEIDLRLTAGLRIMDFDRDEIDAAIRFGYGPDDGLHSTALAQEWVTPVMTPALAALYGKPDDLINAPLIHDDSINFLRNPVDWAAWFSATDMPADTTHGSRFSQADHAIDAALAGAGVVLARITLAHKDIVEGRLVAPFQTALTTTAKFLFLCPIGHEKRPNIAAFKSWVLAQSDPIKTFGQDRNFIAAADIPPPQ